MTGLDWAEANQQYLMAHVERVRLALERHGQRVAQEEVSSDGAQDPAEPVMVHEDPAALARLCELFGLSPFERDLLLLCAGVELDARFPALCARARGDPGRDYPTFSLALAALPAAHWNALSPAAPLRHWSLLELEGGRTLTYSPLRLDERVLHYLTGVSHLDERLADLVRPLRPRHDLVPSRQALVQTIVQAWSGATDFGDLPIVQMCGPESHGKRAIAGAVCADFGLDLYLLPAVALPTAMGELARLARLWEREAVLSGSGLLLDCGELEPRDHERENAIAWLLEGQGGLFFVSSRERRGPWQRPTLTFDVHKPTFAEQRTIWRAALGQQAANLDGRIGQLVAQFNLNGLTIRAAASGVRGQLAGSDNGPAVDPADVGRALWDLCREQARPRLDDLAQRIAPVASWEELVLPEARKSLLREIAMHVRQRAQVYENWDFISKGQRGLGVSALFAGASGTGKTMAAEVLARELRLDLYRIDLSAVVSKYIGETEKNLRRVFDAAEDGGAILLFDEADALFGKRSEVKDSHDRFANIEVSYLLQRMEAYLGLAILTTNLRDALDSAFLRRIRFIVQFPFPPAAARAAIWGRIFPAATPTQGLDVNRLAQLNIPGGNIRNIALNAAFLAADAGEPVGMGHLLRAAQREYAKAEKKLTAAEIRGWEDAGQS
jgi:hypothetical protein